MASLEELLAMEGFKKRSSRSKGRPSTSVPSRAATMPLYSNGDSRLRRGRAQSDVYSQRADAIVREGEGARDRSSSSRLARRDSNVDTSYDMSQEVEDFEVESYNASQGLGDSGERYQIWLPDSMEESEYGSNEIQEIEEPRGRYPDKPRAVVSYDKRYSNDLFEDESKLQVKASFGANPRGRGMDIQRGASDSVTALDEAATLALVSILTGYIRPFVKDENFRASIRRGCHTCLGITEANDDYYNDDRVITNLRGAIAVVERVVQDAADPMELKKLSLKLSIITGLNSKELKNKYTSGIPNSDIVACAHIYLSVVYRLQKKYKAAARHLMQAFCESPNQSRTTLMPGLWDHLLFPHLAHLKVWYEKELELILLTPSETKKMKLLDKVFNNALDGGTYQLAVYYKEWLTDSPEAPKLPSIQVPFASFPGISQDNSHLASSEFIFSSHNPISSQPLINNKLYESVFSQSEILEASDEMLIIEEDKVDEEIDEPQLTRHKRTPESIKSSKSGTHEDDHIREDPSVYTSDSYASPIVEKHTVKDANGLDTPEIEEIVAKSISSWTHKSGTIHGPNLVSQRNESAQTLEKVVRGVFQPPNISEARYSMLNNNGIAAQDMQLRPSILTPSEASFGNPEDINQGSLFFNIPDAFICPITHHLFKEPVTLETGQTFEAVAIKEWFEKGNRTCPVTGKELEFLSVPVTNFLLKRLIDNWKSEYSSNFLVLATETACIHDSISKDQSALLVLEQLLSSFSIEEEIEISKYVVSLRVLQFLLERLELGDLVEKTHVISLMLSCIKADGSCRSYLAMNINGKFILDLLHSKRINARNNVVLLMIELICLNRRTVITSFLSSLKIEAIVNTMHVLLLHLQSSPPEEKVLVAVLLLHLDLLEQPRMFSLYREEAIDSIILDLDCCLSGRKLLANTQRALLMLGGHFSSSGEILTEIWLLKEAGYYDGSSNVRDNYSDEIDKTILGEEEIKRREEWSNNVAFVLLGNGKRSLVETLSTCLCSKNTELVRTCLTTVAWLSRALASLSITEIHISAFSALISPLRHKLEDDQQIENRVLASLSLLNFSKIPECRVPLMKHAEEICNSLKSLVEASWAAEDLYNACCGECL